MKSVIFRLQPTKSTIKRRPSLTLQVQTYRDGLLFLLLLGRPGQATQKILPKMPLSAHKTLSEVFLSYPVIPGVHY